MFRIYQGDEINEVQSQCTCKWIFFIWCHIAKLLLLMSSVVDWNPFRNRLNRHIFDRFAVVFDKLGIHTVVDLFQPLYLWHRCVSLAFVHRELLVLIQLVCHYDDPVTRLYIKKWSIVMIKNRKEKHYFDSHQEFHLREIVRAHKHLRLVPRWSLLYCDELFDFAKQPNQEPNLCEHESPPRRQKTTEKICIQSQSWLENIICVE